MTDHRREEVTTLAAQLFAALFRETAGAKTKTAEFLTREAVRTALEFYRLADELIEEPTK